MSKRSVRLLLEDIQEAIVKINRFTQKMDINDFLKDEKTTDAVVRNLEIIGEAACRIPVEFKQQHSIVEWNKIVGLRHRIVHEYFGIDSILIWQIIQNDLPSFNIKLQIMIDGL